jgi:hypothetical protein
MATKTTKKAPAKKTPKKDLPAAKDIKGGRQQGIFV